MFLADNHSAITIRDSRFTYENMVIDFQAQLNAMKDKNQLFQYLCW